MNKFYITTPIYYANSLPHLGHIYATILGDTIARVHRLRGEKTFFLVGTDEHGAKIQEAANRSGKESQKFVDDIATEFKKAWKHLQIANDNFIRTTDSTHITVVQKALLYLYERGDIYKGFHEGLYCVGCEQFKNENDLVNGLCPDHRRVPVVMKEESYLFRLSKYQNAILKKIKSNELQIIPATRKNEVISFYEQEGLKDISFSRKNVSWGVPIPWDRSHTAYVWADAFLSYLTGIGWDGRSGSVPEFWPADVHLMAKDILRVHATIWPAMLLALDLPLPRILLIHGLFLVEGEKMSKTLGNVVDPLVLEKKYGADVVRYFLLREVPLGKDGDFSYKKLEERYNGDLANGLGNLVSRVATLIENNMDGELTYDSKKLEFKVLEQQNYDEAIWEFRLHDALGEVWKIVAQANQYIDEQKPWVQVRENPKEFLETLTSLVAMIHNIAWSLQPFLPETSNKIAQIFGDDLSEKEIPDSYHLVVKKGEPLFPRIK